MKNQAPPPRNTQAGNALFIILLGIAMFAALSWALMQGLRGGSSNLTDQQAKLVATEVLEFMNKVKDSYKSLLISGCAPLNINFNSTVFLRGNGTVVDPAPPGATNACSIYNVAGSNINPVIIEKAIFSGYTPASANPRGMHFVARHLDTGLGTANNDLAYFVYGMDLKVCVAFLNLTRADDTVVTTVPIDSHDWASGQSWDVGTPGTLDPISINTSSMTYAVRMGSSSTYCIAGIILQVK